MVQALAGDAYVSVRVANDDWPPTEHGRYWTNFAEGMSRIVHVITSGASADFGDHPLADEVRRQVQRCGPAHRRSVAVASTGRIALLLLAVDAAAGWPPRLAVATALIATIAAVGAAFDWSRKLSREKT